MGALIGLLHVKARQAQGAAGNKNKAGQPADASKRLQGPQVHDQGWGHSEAYQIAERIVLGTKLTGGVGQASDSAI